MLKFGSSRLPGARPALAAFVACLACFAAHAQDYPSRPVRVVVPSAPGGGFDLVGRVLAQKLGEQMGQAFVVENRPGAGTSAEVRSRLEMGSGRSLRMAPAETETLVKAEVAKWTGLLRRAGITPE